MRVSELAKELKVSDKAVLDKLRALKLKAKDGEQELNVAVASVVRSEINKDLKDPAKRKAIARAAEKAAKKMAEEEAMAPPVVVAKTKKVKTTKTTAKTPAKAKEDVAEKKAAAPTKKVVKKKEPKAKGEPVVDPAVQAPPPPPPPEPKPAVVKPKPVEAPFVSLKPLAKKRRRPTERSGEGEGEERGAAAGLLSMGGVPTEGVGVSPAGESGSPAVVLAPLELQMPISVKDFAVRVQQKTSVILKKLMEMGFIVNINQNLDEEISKKLAREFGFEVVSIKTQEEQLLDLDRQEADDPAHLTPRAPVVTLMGHVDHGKTSLLDRIRKSRVADSEHGGITQHIGAYSVEGPKGRITFLDTPGHEAFTSMRARGAHITDLVILVVAADEGIMPQTEEAIDHARAADVPIVVALNKIDHRHADPDRVKKQLGDHGLQPEDWGGKTIVVGVSALTGEGVASLLDMILLESEMLELKVNKDKDASGIVIEAHMSPGKGAIAALIVQSGTLKINDMVVVGPYLGKVKAMFNDREKSIKEAGPSMPVEILGLPGVPEAGERFYVLRDEKLAREIAANREQQLKNQKLATTAKLTLEDLYSKIKEGSIKELNVVLKTDVQGSLEALRDSIAKIPSDEVKVKFIHTGVGEVNTSDVILAAASDAVIIAFQVGVDSRASQELEKHPVDVRKYRIIYDAVNEIRKALEGMLDPKKRRRFLARIEVRQVFKLSKSGIVAGCFVVKGRATRKSKVDVTRNGEVVFSGEIASLKRFKDDVKEVQEGYECGVTVAGFDAIEAGDILETYEVETIARTFASSEGA